MSDIALDKKQIDDIIRNEELDREYQLLEPSNDEDELMELDSEPDYGKDPEPHGSWGQL